MKKTIAILCATLLMLSVLLPAGAALAAPYYYYPYYPYSYSYGYYGQGRVVNGEIRYSISTSSTGFYGTGDIIYTISAPSYELKNVYMAHTRLSSNQYSVYEDGYLGTRIVLHERFLNSKEAGIYNLQFNFQLGRATASLNIVSSAASDEDVKPYAYSGSTSSKHVRNGNGSVLRDVTVYSKASSSGTKLGSYSKGAAILVTGFTGSGTYAIVQFSQNTGYIKADYVQASLSGAMTGQTSRSTTLYTRQSSSSSYAYGTVEKGTTLELLSREGAYWAVRFNHETLYVRASYIRNIAVG